MILCRIDGDFFYITVQVARGYVPLLPFPLIVMHPQGVAIRSAEFSVYIHESLDVVFSRWNLPDAFQGVSEIVFIDDGPFGRPKRINILAPERHTQVSGLKPGFPVVVSRDDGVNASGDGLGMYPGRERDFERESAFILRGSGRA